MKKIERKLINLFLGIFISITIIIPALSFAQTPPIAVGGQAQPENVSVYQQIKNEDKKYKFIVPLGPFSSIVSDTTDLTTGDALIQYLRTWFKFLIGIGGVIGVVRLVMVGFSIITSAGSVDAKSKIRGELVSIITSLVLVAGSWVFLNTLNPALVKSSILISKTTATSSPDKVVISNANTPDADVLEGLHAKGFYFVIINSENGLKRKAGPYASVEQCMASATKYKTVQMKPPYTMNSTQCYDHTNYNSTTQEKTLRDYLAQNNIYPNKSSCTYPTQKDCTKIEGLSMSALTNIVSLSSSCCKSQTSCKGQVNDALCPIVITGGTEFGHKSHGAAAPSGMGEYTFDLRRSSTLLNFLDRKSDIITQSVFGAGKLRYKYNGYWYSDEDAYHFHVCKEDPNVSGVVTVCGKIPPAEMTKTMTYMSDPENSPKPRCLYITDVVSNVEQLICDGVKK